MQDRGRLEVPSREFDVGAGRHELVDAVEQVVVEADLGGTELVLELLASCAAR